MHRLRTIYRGKNDHNPVYKYEHGIITMESVELLLEDMFLEIDIKRELSQAEVGFTRKHLPWLGDSIWLTAYTQ